MTRQMNLGVVVELHRLRRIKALVGKAPRRQIRKIEVSFASTFQINEKKTYFASTFCQFWILCARVWCFESRLSTDHRWTNGESMLGANSCFSMLFIIRICIWVHLNMFAIRIFWRVPAQSVVYKTYTGGWFSIYTFMINHFCEQPAIYCLNIRRSHYSKYWILVLNNSWWKMVRMYTANYMLGSLLNLPLLLLEIV